MEEKTTIRKYIRWFNKKMRLITLILLAAAVGLGFLSYWIAHRSGGDPVPMDTKNGSIGDNAYVDAVGVSDWVYRVGDNTTYYMLMDAERNCYVARIPAKEISKYTAQKRWFEGDTDEEKPVRITGMVTKTTSSVKEAFIQWLEIDEVEFNAYFGSKMLAVGESSKSNLSLVFAILAIAAGAAALTLLLIALLKLPMEKKAVKRLEERGLLDQAEAELNAPTVQSLKNDRFRLGSRFLFGRGMGLAASWDEVLWCYISRHNVNGFVTHNLNVCTADRKTHSLPFRQKREDEMRELMVTFSQYNPEMCLGYSMENQKLFRERTRK